MKKAEFLKEVLEELDTIKEKATEEEISRLDFTDFNHTKMTRCIYGQMTGNCDSMRARFIRNKRFFGLENDLTGGYKIKYGFKKQTFIRGDRFTALEKYLYMVESSVHKKIISYLKGEIDSIKLK